MLKLIKNKGKYRFALNAVKYDKKCNQENFDFSIPVSQLVPVYPGLHVHE